MYLYTIVKRINDKSLFLIVMIVYHFSNKVVYGKKWVSKKQKIWTSIRDSISILLEIHNTKKDCHSYCESLPPESINRWSKFSDRWSPSWKIFLPLAIYVAGLVLVAYVSGNHPSNGISWFPRSSQHQIPPNLICHSPPPSRLSSSSALWWDEPQPASRDFDHLNPHWATLLTHLARERALCAAPSTHLLASSVILSFLIISRHPLYLIILHRWSRNRARACPASPWLGHPGGRVGNQEHTGDQSFLLLFISSHPLSLHS